MLIPADRLSESTPRRPPPSTTPTARRELAPSNPPRPGEGAAAGRSPSTPPTRHGGASARPRPRKAARRRGVASRGKRNARNAQRRALCSASVRAMHCTTSSPVAVLSGPVGLPTRLPSFSAPFSPLCRRRFPRILNKTTQVKASSLRLTWFHQRPGGFEIGWRRLAASAPAGGPGGRFALCAPSRRAAAPRPDDSPSLQVSDKTTQVSGGNAST